ncbi:hypothetical protein GCM10027300_32310 [Modestobacter lapidis]
MDWGDCCPTRGGRRGAGCPRGGSVVAVTHGGAQATIEAFTETQWVTLRGDLPAYPF